MQERSSPGSVNAMMYITDYGRAAGEACFSLLSQVRKAAIHFYQLLQEGELKMSKVAIVYWSGTGNTEAMANSVADGAKGAGAEVKTFTCAEFGPADAAGFDGIAFGCPAMGAEVLEESEFQPLWDDVKIKLSGKKVGLLAHTDGVPVSGWTAGLKMRRCQMFRSPQIL